LEGLPPTQGQEQLFSTVLADPVILTPRGRMSERDHQESDDFTTQSTQARTSLVREFVDFLKQNKKWWIAPIIIITLFLGLLVMMGGTAAAPFVYTLF
jgi:hypothetical protein